MRTLIILIRVILVFGVITNLLSLSKINSLSSFGTVVLVFYIIFMVWWVTVKLKRREKLKNYLHQVWGSLGYLFIAAGFLGLLGIWNGEFSDQPYIYCFVILGGVLLLKEGFGAKQKILNK